MKLNSGQRRLLHLIAKKARIEGYAKVSNIVWPLSPMNSCIAGKRSAPTT